MSEIRSSEARPAAGPCSAGRPLCHVLVADDHPPGLVLATEAMQRHHCNVVAVADGAAAVQAARSQDFGLIFLDVHMPAMGGLAAATEIRRWEAAAGRRRTPIVALTASAMPHEQQACLRHDMDDVLLKPFRLESLARMLDKWCPA